MGFLMAELCPSPTSLSVTPLLHPSRPGGFYEVVGELGVTLMCQCGVSSSQSGRSHQKCKQLFLLLLVESVPPSVYHVPQDVLQFF